MIKDRLVDLIENTIKHEEVVYLACNEERAVFASEEHKRYNLASCQKVTEALIYLLDNIYIRFGSKLYRQNVGIPMGINCPPPPPPLVAHLFLFCYERDFMKPLTKEKRFDLIDAFNSTSRHLDDLLNIDNIHSKPPWYLATDRSKAAILVQFYLNVLWSMCFMLYFVFCC